MNWTPEKVDSILNEIEGEKLEFKEARTSFQFDELVKYCAALANEGGGSIVLGVTDRRPRWVVGSQAFPQPERTRTKLIEILRIDVSCSVVSHPAGRVLVFDVPQRPVGTAVKVDGRY